MAPRKRKKKKIKELRSTHGGELKDPRCGELSMPLSPEQCEIVLKPPSERILVTAGPGTGKTHLLIGRIEALIRFYGVQPGRELLVLSFSRAVVYELKKRLKEAGGDACYVNAYTFDSFATRLLSQFRPNGTWTSEDYDGRIKIVCRLIEMDSAVGEQLGQFAHVLVDEIQDLVGDRAEFVKLLIHQSGTGFTLLGDPAQGIYNFQMESEWERRVGSAALYKAIREQYGSELLEYTLKKNYRIQSRAANVADPAGILLNLAKPDYPVIATHLLESWEGLPSLGKIKDAAAELQNLEGTTAILTRNNGQALLVSRLLSEKGIAHTVRQRATDRIVAPWIGRLFNTVQFSNIGKSSFSKLAESRLNGDLPDIEEAWDLLKRIEGKRGRQLDVLNVARQLGQGNVPDELTRTPSTSLVVSTIHRAKGLEFDNVVLLQPDDIRETQWIEEETRTLFVALTRAKSQYYRLVQPGEFGLQQTDQNRWFVRRDKWRTNSVEIRGTDVHSGDPAGNFLHMSDPQAIQDYLYNEVKPGDPLTIDLFRSGLGNRPRAFYQIKHSDTVVGLTDEGFSYELYSILKVNPGWQVQQWPVGFEDVYVQGIDTVAGSSAAGRKAGINSGIWLRVRIAGFGRTIWK